MINKGLLLLRWLLGLSFFTGILLTMAGFFLPSVGLFLFFSVLGFYLAFEIFLQGTQWFVLKKIVESFAIVLMIVTLTFGLLRIVPGGPFDEEKALPKAVKEQIEAKYHLNEPIHTQYLIYMKGLLKGDLGESYKYVGRNISEIVAQSLPNSVQLGVYALLVAFAIGIPAGVLAAARHNSWVDTTTMMAAISGVALPSFLIAPLLILFFSLHLKWLPPAFWEGPEYYLLPTVVLGIRPAAVIARLTRASVLEVIRADFIRTAKAKGLSESVILYRHVLRNSLIPVVTFSGPLIAGLITGSFVIEEIFAIPGMAKHLIQSVSNRDYPLILAMTLVFSVILVFANLVVDLLYVIIDPRMKGAN